MANNNINRYIGALALGTVLMAVPGCTDTWDDHYNNESASGTTNETLWEVISSNPSYSNFAKILQQTKYYKDNTHPVPTYSYADVLNGGQVNTVWVPDNNALTDEECQKWLDMLAADAEGGGSLSGYNVQQQFVGNHIALWRHNISEPGIDTIKMINGKNLVFDKNYNKEQGIMPTLGGIPLAEDGINIATANGVMHVIQGIAPFQYNFYEYLKYREPVTKFGEYVVSKDTIYFSAFSSIEGLPDENGNPTYVDSVYYTSNRLFERTFYLPTDGSEKWQMAERGFGARINNEDSVFVMLLPSDAAWEAAKEKLRESHQYAAQYEDKSKGDLNTTPVPVIKMTDEEKDSLQNMSIEMDIVSPLVFNIHKQPKRGGLEMWELESFAKEKGEGIDYVLNTFGDTLRNVGDWNKTSLFNGNVVEMSNGIGFEIDSWDFPVQYYTPDVEVEIENSGVFYNTESSRYKVGSGSRRYPFSNETFKDITNVYGKVSNGNFYHFDAPGPTSGPKVDIKLYGNSPNAYVPNAQVMSGKYDIQIVVVPHWYMDLAQEGYIDEKFYIQRVDTLVNPEDETDTTFVQIPTDELDTHYIDSIAGINKYKIKATLSYSNNTARDKTEASKVIDYDGLKVDTLTVLSDFEFPYSYKNMRFTYPTLYIEGQTGRNDPKNGFVFDLVIDKIILKRK